MNSTPGTASIAWSESSGSEDATAARSSLPMPAPSVPGVVPSAG